MDILQVFLRNREDICATGGGLDCYCVKYDMIQVDIIFILEYLKI